MLELVIKLDNGTVLDVSPNDQRRLQVQPLGFEVLSNVVENEDSAFEAVINGVRAPKEITGLEVDGPLTVSMRLNMGGELKVFGLVRDGWLPAPWTHKRVAMLDRNLIGQLRSLRHSNGSANSQEAPLVASWMGLANDVVSPVPSVLEGSKQRLQSDYELRCEIQRASRTLSEAFPASKLMHIGTKQRAALRALLIEREDARLRTTKLLMQAAPMVAEPKAAERPELEARVFEAARSVGVAPTSLVVIALLSCIYDNARGLGKHGMHKPGRAVVKPSPTYTENKAYNAVADLGMVELLLNAYSLWDEQELVLYTGDKGLTAFWVALQPCGLRSQSRPGGKVRAIANFTISKHLFPALETPEALTGLAARIEAAA